MDRSVAPALLMIIAGIWLTLQTLAGDLPRRLLSLALWEDDTDDTEGAAHESRRA